MELCQSQQDIKAEVDAYLAGKKYCDLDQVLHLLKEQGFEDEYLCLLNHAHLINSINHVHNKDHDPLIYKYLGQQESVKAYQCEEYRQAKAMFNKKGNYIFELPDILRTYDGVVWEKVSESDVAVTYAQKDHQENVLHIHEVLNFYFSKARLLSDVGEFWTNYVQHTYENGDKYEGYELDGSFHGQGRYTWANGDVYEGNFVQGVKEGQGSFTNQDGVSYTGLWHDDLLIKKE